MPWDHFAHVRKMVGVVRFFPSRLRVVRSRTYRPAVHSRPDRDKLRR